MKTKRKSKNNERQITKDPIGAHLFLDNIPYIEDLMKQQKKTRAEVLRELVDNAICFQRVKEFGLNETTQQFKNNLSTITKDALQPIRKRLDELFISIKNLNEEVEIQNNSSMSNFDIAESIKRINNRLERFSDVVYEIKQQLEVKDNNQSRNLDAEYKEEFNTLKNLSELSLRNLVGIRAIIWVHLLEIVGARGKGLSGNSNLHFALELNEYLYRLFTSEALKEAAYIRADLIHEYVANEAQALYTSLKKDYPKA